VVDEPHGAGATAIAASKGAKNIGGKATLRTDAVVTAGTHRTRVAILSCRTLLVEALGTRFGSKLRTVAKAETTGYVRAFRRAFDWLQRCRLRSVA
jgi:hypothetical protein